MPSEARDVLAAEWATLAEARSPQAVAWAEAANAETRRVMGVSVAPEIPERQEARAYLSGLLSDEEAAARVAADLARVRSLGERPRDQYAGLSWSFAAACRAADEKQRRKPVDPGIERARALLADEVTLEHAWHETNHPWRAEGRLAESVVDALVFGLRDGLDAIKDPSNQRRLSQLDAAQMREVVGRVQGFMPHVAPAWKPTDVKALVSIWSKLR